MTLPGRIRALAVFALILMTASLVEAETQMTHLEDDEQAHLLPTYAVWSGDAWQAELHFWIFELEPEGISRWPIKKMARLALGDAYRPANHARIEHRLNLALADSEAGKRLQLRIPVNVETPVSGSNGQGKLVLSIADHPPSSSGLKTFAVQSVATEDGRTFQTQIFAIPPDGLSVISDIDDTIKVSGVLDREELLKNTLARPFIATPVLPYLYKWLAKHGSAFHYVSSSPRFLSPVLEAFLNREALPSGSMHLKSVRLKGTSVFDLFKPSTETKPPVLNKILDDFPGRKFVLVGDAGESDPELYADLLQRRGGQVAFVLIRRVDNTPSELERLQTTFRGCPPDRWAFFSDSSHPKELMKQLSRATGVPMD